MPELPEVETTRRGIAPLIEKQTVSGVVVRQRRLRWPVPMALRRELPGQRILSVARRGKYLLITTPGGTVILHLGMSGSLQIVPASQPAGKYDHVDLVLKSGDCLRLRDPRRFGTVLWTKSDPYQHKLLARLGPEPLSAGMTGEYLYLKSRNRKRCIRDFLMDGHVLAGIGNIYANEALFAAGIRPQCAAGRLTHAQCARLAHAIKATLRRAIRAGGTTLRDFRRSDGRPGYFTRKLSVYARQGMPCRVCGAAIKSTTRGQRSVFFCARCQK